MYFDHHIKSLTCTCLFHLRNIAKLRSVVSQPVLEMITHSFKSSRVDCCNSLWLPIMFRIHFMVLVFTYRALYGQAPLYICDLLHPYITIWSLRSSDQGLLVVPRSWLKTKGVGVFEVVALALWNTLPIDIRSAVSDALKNSWRLIYSNWPLSHLVLSCVFNCVFLRSVAYVLLFVSFYYFYGLIF